VIETELNNRIVSLERAIGDSSNSEPKQRSVNSDITIKNFAISGESIPSGVAVYRKTSDKKYYKITTAENLSQYEGVTINAVARNVSMSVVYIGKAEIQGGDYRSNKSLYVGSNGRLTNSPSGDDWISVGTSDGKKTVTLSGGSGITPLTVTVGTFERLKLWDTDKSNVLNLSWDENDTSDRALNLKVSGGNRTLSLLTDVAINQNLLETSYVTFAGVTSLGKLFLSGVLDVYISSDLYMEDNDIYSCRSIGGGSNDLLVTSDFNFQGNKIFRCDTISGEGGILTVSSDINLEGNRIFDCLQIGSTSPSMRVTSDLDLDGNDIFDVLNLTVDNDVGIGADLTVFGDITLGALKQLQFGSSSRIYQPLVNKLTMEAFDSIDMDTDQVNVNNELEVFGIFSAHSGIRLKISTKTSLYVINVADYEIWGDTDSGSFSFTLPAGIQDEAHRLVNVGTSGNLLEIKPNGSEKLIGKNSSFYLKDGESLIVLFDEIYNWY